jgi:hypothetical protein
MRTTLTLDDDVATIIERLRRKKRQSLKAVINDALREGLKRLEEPPRTRRPFHTGTVDLGRCLPGSVDNVAEVLAVAEGESFK